MTKQVLAIALCRVSSLEQLQNNSLKNQKDIVIKTAEVLGANIPSDGVWAGQVSSKVGVNFNRKDLKEMFEYCKTHTAVRYLIVSEVDRFMRSPDEQTYWIVKFGYEINVKVWFADKPELNDGTHEASLLRYLDGWRAGGSNKERITKSINGQTAALQEGRYPFAPKPGYKKGYRSGIQELHEVRGPILQETLVKIASHLITPSQGLVELNKSKFVEGRALYKLDKFRKIVTDPFYAGIVSVDKQVKVRNENGLHEPLITKEQHYELVEIMNSKQKNQTGPRKNGNPKYPVSNLVICAKCLAETNGRFVGLDLHNGKNRARVYEKYRCRACKRYLTKDELHSQVEQQFRASPITKDGLDDFLKSLELVWKENEGQAEQEAVRVRHQIKDLEKSVEQKVEAVTDPSNASVKDDILVSIEKKKAEIVELEERLEQLKADADNDWQEFLRYAYNFADNMGRTFLETSKENRLRCKQIIFPAGFYVDDNKKVYTPEVSPLITLLSNDKVQMVRVTRL